MGASERIRTYVAGFDEKLSGGIPPRSIVLLAGEAGAIKSTVGRDVLFHRGGENCGSHLRGMGMDPKEVEDKVSIVDLGMIRKNLEGMAESTWVEIFKMYAQNLKKSLNYELLVVDSLTVLEALARFDNPREQMFQLFEWLRDLKATTFLVSEMRSKNEDFGTFGEEFLSDGIIHVKMERVDDANIQRRRRGGTRRGSPHSPNFYTLIFQNGVLQVTRILSESGPAIAQVVGAKD